MLTVISLIIYCSILPWVKIKLNSLWSQKFSLFPFRKRRSNPYTVITLHMNSFNFQRNNCITLASIGPTFSKQHTKQQSREGKLNGPWLHSWKVVGSGTEPRPSGKITFLFVILQLSTALPHRIGSFHICHWAQSIFSFLILPTTIQCLRSFPYHTP